MYRKIPKQDTKDLGKIEKGFELPLKTRIEGADGFGNPFYEDTVLSYISHQGSTFWLTTPVAIGSELRLEIDLPEKLSMDENLKMIIKGKVVFVETSKEDPTKQRVTLQFENKYLIEPD